MALGTLVGGWRIVRTMGSRITRLHPVQGFCAETGGAITLFLVTHCCGLRRQWLGRSYRPEPNLRDRAQQRAVAHGCRSTGEPPVRQSATSQRAPVFLAIVCSGAVLQGGKTRTSQTTAPPFFSRFSYENEPTERLATVPTMGSPPGTR